MERSDRYRCPRCKGALVATEHANECHACNLSYPVIDGIPTFIPSEATPIADDRRNPRR